MAVRANSDNLSFEHSAPEGDRAATLPLDFAEMWSHRETIERACRRIVGDSASVDDVVQDTYLRALRVAGHLEPRTSTAPWLTTVARRRSIDELRRRRRVATAVLPADVEAHPSQDPAHQVLQHEMVERLHVALASLSVRERTLLLQQAGLGASVIELAAQEATSVASVRSVLTRARRKVRLSMEQSGGLLAVFPLQRLGAGLRSLRHRWVSRIESVVPVANGIGWPLSQLVAAVVALSALPGLLPSTEVATAGSAVRADARPSPTSVGRAPEWPASSGPAGDAASGGDIAPSVGDRDADDVLPPGVEIPPLDDVPQPEQADIDELAASPDGRVVFAFGNSARTGQPVLYRSLDGGRSWARLDDGSPGGVQRNNLPAGGGEMLVSPEFDTDERLFMLAARGLHRSDDGGRTFTLASPVMGAAVLASRFGAGDDRVYLAGPPTSTYDDRMRRTTPFVPVPVSLSGGGIALAPDFATTGDVLVGGKANPGTGDTPAVFTCAPRRGCAVRAFVPGLPRAPRLLVSANRPNVVFAWTADFLYRSDDGGRTFAAQPLPTWFALERVTQGDGRVFLLGRSDGGGSGLLASADDGASWTALGAGTDLARGVHALVAVPGNRLIGAPAYGLGLLCSHDGGATWHERCRGRGPSPA